MQTLKGWRAAAPLRLASSSLLNKNGKRFPGWSAVQVRCRGLLRKVARAELQEQNAKSCLVLSPEDKILHRLDRYSSLLPCPSQSFPPRIEHLVCLEDGYVVDLVSKSLDLPLKYVEELVDFGAIYHALVCPPPPEGSTNINEGIEAGSYLRVHVHLKRFPRCYKIDWKSRIIAHTESYVVLDKPAGVPVGHSLDNFVECCAVFAGRSLGLDGPLRLTHQLDNCTEGCVVLAKTKEFSSEFHSRLRKKEVKKYYLVLAAAPVPLGLTTHYMRPATRHPRVLSPVPLPGWAKCELEVLECKEVPWPAPEVEARYRVQNLGWKAHSVAYECKVQLLTGRTHQVRAQFASLRAPVIGDTMYMPAIARLLKSPDVYPFQNVLAEVMEDIEADADSNIFTLDEKILEDWIALHGSEPECTIGLQASDISWDDGVCVYKANDPWWR
ncbi:hypothetical protein L7F22_033217 [Adiantum nelumboides]|nr:hypothetical protein [Adiantum nelumboides]